MKLQSLLFDFAQAQWILDLGESRPYQFSFEKNCPTHPEPIRESTTQKTALEKLVNLERHGNKLERFIRNVNFFDNSKMAELCEIHSKTEHGMKSSSISNDIAKRQSVLYLKLKL